MSETKNVLNTILDYCNEYSGVSIKNIGYVESFSDGIASVIGLPDVKMGGMVKFENGIFGMVFNIKYDSVDIVILESAAKINQGIKVESLGTQIEIPVGKELLGRVVDPLCRPIDDIKSDFSAVKERRKIEVEAPSIMSRQSVNSPMQTGINVIDSLVPIGRGQRELIIGDRGTGKTTIAIDTIVNQARLNKSLAENEKVYSVYVAIGQKQSSTARIVKELSDKGALEYTIIVSASASDAAALQFLAPYAGCTMAEYFRDNGMHALIIYDDLSKHAVAYRQLSLLLRRPPGREAFPGDVFYIHSRLLERAANMSKELKSGSLTALPIIETQSGDISSYVPTNVISITDGQIFLDSELFNKGVRPAINVGFSVSRVGSAAQTKAIKKVSGRTKAELAQFRELESFSQMGSDVDAVTLKILKKGSVLIESLKQKNGLTYSLFEQTIILYAATKGYMDNIEIKKITDAKQALIDFFNIQRKSIVDVINVTKDIPENELEAIDSSIKEALAEFN